MKLAHHDTLGSINDEGPELGQKREVTEVHFFLDDVLSHTLFNGRRLLLLFLPLLLLLFLFLGLLPDDEAERRLQGRRVRHVSLDALLYGVLRLTERTRDVLEHEVLVDVLNREDLPENTI